MFDGRLIMEQKDRVLASMHKRNFKDIHLIEAAAELIERRKRIITESETARAQQNKRSKDMPQVMKSGTPEEKKAIQEDLKALAEQVKAFQPRVKAVEEELDAVLLAIPNLLADDAPEGGEENAVEVSVWGEKPQFDFTPKEHDDLAKGLFDPERGAKLAGARFSVLWGKLATLERVLIQFMLDIQTRERGYTEVLTPLLVNRATMTATGQLPKFEEDLFKTNDDLFLIPTAEVPVTNLHRDEILREEDLPRSYCAYTPCFRREAGSYGKDTKGYIRQHQFNKVELVKFTRPEDSDAELMKLLRDAEEILRRLGLHYRVVRLAAQDQGFSSSKTFDIEVWLPGQGRYREISSCSSFTDYQARRGNIRFKRAGAKATELCHTLNGSGLAIGRTLIAIVENYQRADGTIVVPEALRPYMGCEVITPA
ncbi:MAG TPA: serine--tRNA ligase [bacterium]|nr:serine--tRNA ligase [bacterium]